MAEREGTTKSDLFRRMVNTYKAEREEQEFFALQRKMSRRVRKISVFTEAQMGESFVRKRRRSTRKIKPARRPRFLESAR